VLEAMVAAILKAMGATQRIVSHRRVIFPIKNNSFSKWKYQQAPACMIAVSWHIRHLLLNYGIAPGRINVVYDSAELPEALSEAMRDQARERLGLEEKSLLGCVGHFAAERGTPIYQGLSHSDTVSRPTLLLEMDRRAVPN
jgi:hypothetical protein